MKKPKPKLSAAFGLIPAQIPPWHRRSRNCAGCVEFTPVLPLVLWQSCPWDRAQLLLGLSPSSAPSQPLQEGSGEDQERLRRIRNRTS